MMGTCPDCEENFEIADTVEIGDTIECAACKAKLEVLDLHPVVLDYAIDKEEMDSLHE
jgi:lysine biosynthesis protein LysW